MTVSSPAAARPGAESLPRTFGRYTLFDHIGRGGMADIYLAVQKDDLVERRVVLKEILPELSGDAGFSRMLVSEAKLAANLRHANVVQVIDLGRSDERLFIVMEYVEGFDLNQLLARLSSARVALPAEFAVFIVRETLRALDYAHRARDAEGRRLGVVHRDVSPANVLISFEGEIKLCDFGIARALDVTGEDQAERVYRSLVGKAAYMSPEHARGEGIDARADVFAAGIILWELCAGRRLYKGTDEEMLALARAADVPPLPDRGLPEHARLQTVLDRALAPDRENRYASAAELLAALEDWAASTGLLASQLKFGSFLTERFGEAVVAERRARQRRASEPPPPPAPMAPGVVERSPDDWMELGPTDEVEEAAPAVATVDTRRLPAQDAPPREPFRMWVFLLALALFVAGVVLAYTVVH